jgi:hypothetical protein
MGVVVRQLTWQALFDGGVGTTIIPGACLFMSKPTAHITDTIYGVCNIHGWGIQKFGIETLHSSNIIHLPGQILAY